MNPIVLSRRMQGLVNMLREETTPDNKISCVTDIGCDHAFVSMYLVQNNICDRVIAMDVRKGPLEIATNNIHKYGLEHSVETRLSNGFQKLQCGEASWAIIAGMGGLLINSILEAGKAHLCNKIGLILQPQSELDEVRKYLIEHSYKIVEEEFLCEENKFYTIIKAVYVNDAQMELEDYEMMYGPVLLQRKHPVLREFLVLQQNKYSELEEKLGVVDTEHSRLRAKEIQQEMNMITKALSLYKEE